MGASLSSCCASNRIVVLNGRQLYVKQTLGEGGFSFVYLVEDARTGELFALKKMACQDEGQHKDAIREVELYRLFNHPNIIKVVDYCTVRANSGDPDQKDVYVLLPLFRNGSLHDAILGLQASKEHFQEEQILKIFHGICLAVQQLHKYTPADKDTPTPLAHRDLKPANVLLGVDDLPVLMDFGSVAKGRVEVTNRQEAMKLQDVAAERCSMPYRAPELFDVPSQCVIDERVDIWSLGCILYAMAYLQSPFETCVNEQGGSIALAVISGRVSFPKADIYSSELNDLITFMLVTDHRRRPTIDEVLERLNQLMNKH
eukprot:Colp12_sorted_trinity150504_noHs@3221